MIEIGKRFLSVKMLEQIARALGVDTPELFITAGVVFMPYQNKSVERLYNEIQGDFEDFKKKLPEELKKSSRSN